MSKLMLIDAAHPEETRVVLTENGSVHDFDFERTGHEQLRGNIYLAKVTRVEPSLQACFVDYGGNRHGFLAFSEIHPDYYQLPQEDRDALLREAQAEADANAADDDSDDGDDEEDDDDVDLRDELEADDGDDDDDGDDEDDSDDASDAKPKPQAKRARRPRRASRNPSRNKYKIQEVIRRRQVMLVQVVKEERGNKGAALTTFLSLAGRYSVLMPNTARGGGISRKISSANDRKRLKGVVSELDVPEGMGLIVRTAGAKRTKTELKRDYDYLSKLWDTIRARTLESMAPCMINKEGGLVHRAMRDMFDKDIEQVLVHGEGAYREAKDLAKLIMPSQARKVQPWKERVPLYSAMDVEEQLSSLFQPIVKLPSGGYLVINQTEALVAVDVNSGKSTREKNIEQTALRTNQEAAAEACRQMRLRDLAGLVVIDFIDMEESKHNRAVEKAVKDALKDDRARVHPGRISTFGLMEMSRQRRRTGVLQASSEVCNHCGGTGRRRTVDWAALQLFRAIEARAADGGLLSITVKAPTDVALELLNSKRDALTELETELGFAVTVDAEASLIPGDFSIEAERDPKAPKPKKVKRPAPPPPPPKSEADEDEDDDEEEVEAKNGGSSDEDDDAPKRKRRRGRRGGRRSRKSNEEDGSENRSDADEDDDDADSGDGNDSGADAKPDTKEDDHEDRPRRRSRRNRRGRRSGGDEGGTEAASKADGDAESDADADAGDAKAVKGGSEAASDKEEVDADSRPRRRSRRRRRSREDTDANAEAASGSDSDSGDTKTTAETNADANASQSDSGSGPASRDESDEGGRSPRRRRRRRRSSASDAADKSEAAEAAPDKVADAPAEAAGQAPAAEPDAEAEAEPDNRVSVAEVEPVAAGGGEEEGSRRRGWWSRRKR